MVVGQRLEAPAEKHKYQLAFLASFCEMKNSLLDILPKPSCLDHRSADGAVSVAATEPVPSTSAGKSTHLAVTERSIRLMPITDGKSFQDSRAYCGGMPSGSEDCGGRGRSRRRVS